VTLSHAENCAIKPSRARARVTIADDDYDFFRSIKRSRLYFVLEFVLIVYALFGNEIVTMVFIRVCQDKESNGRAPIPPRLIDDVVGTANLVLFFFFLTDMVLQVHPIATSARCTRPDPVQWGD
jgi:hypothetical protein